MNLFLDDETALIIADKYNRILRSLLFWRRFRKPQTSRPMTAEEMISQWKDGNDEPIPDSKIPTDIVR